MISLIESHNDLLLFYVTADVLFKEDNNLFHLVLANHHRSIIIVISSKLSQFKILESLIEHPSNTMAFHLKNGALMANA